MPAQFNAAVITDAGRSLIAASAGSQKAIEFTAMKTGNGVYTQAEAATAQLEQATALKSLKQSFSIFSIRKLSDYVALVKSVLSNEDLDTAYNWDEVGIYARLEGSSATPILFSIAVIPEDGGTQIPAYSSTTVLNVLQSFYLEVSNAYSVTIEVNHDTCELLEDAGLNNDLETTERATLVAAINEVNKLSTDMAWMINNNCYYATLTDEGGNRIVDENGNAILCDWSYQIA